MKRFAALYDALDATRATSVKRAALRSYFSEAPPADAAWGLHFLRGGRLKRLIGASRMRTWAAEATGLPDAVLDESFAHVGDFAETLALLFDTTGQRHDDDTPLSAWVARLEVLREADEATQREHLLDWWSHLPLRQCYLLNKLLTGELRVGVSAGLATQALADFAELEPSLIAERLWATGKPMRRLSRR